jgi:DNA-binding NtrC family response regulator
MPVNSNLKICLVDDDIMCLNLYKQFLKQLGYTEVELFDTGSDVIDSLDEIHPDVIFLDYNMEEMNGVDVLKRIKSYNPNIIVLFISGQEDLNVAVNAMKYGAVDFILKASLNPEKMREIMDRVEAIQPEAPAPVKKSFFKKMFS